MPYLKKIVVRDFRNIGMQEISFSPNINCISGGNGEGKTNLMDAIWYLSMTKSALSNSDRFCFRHGTSEFALGGLYRMEDGTESRFSLQVTKDGETSIKKLKRNDKICPRMADHIGAVPIVLVSPSDISLVSESGDERRKFVNAVLSQIDRAYLSGIQQYNKVLLQRNRILKSGQADDGMLDAYDALLTKYAGPVFEARRKFTEELNPVVNKYYRIISSGREDVATGYRSCMTEADLGDILKERREQDKLLRFTTAGIQRDDFIFTMDGQPIRRYGSQGQQKSFLVALKFAQYEIMKEACGCNPILLLDDLFDKLDMDRVANLLQMVAGNDFGQIFITDSNKVRISGIVDAITSDRSYFLTDGGKFDLMENQYFETEDEDSHS